MDLATVLSDPELQSSVVPLVGAFVLVGVIRLIGGASYGRTLAGAGVGLAIVATALVIVGLPPFPPRASGQKLIYLIAGATVIGAILDAGLLRRWVAETRIRPVQLAGALAIWAAGVSWIAAPRLKDFPASPETVTWAVIVIAGGLALWRLSVPHKIPQGAAVALLLGAFGVGGVAFLGASASISQMVFAAAAATGGFLLWNWPTSRFGFGWAVVLGGGLAVAASGAQFALFTRSPAWPMLLVLPIFFLDPLVARFAPSGGKVNDAIASVMLGAVSAVFVIAAIGATLMTGDGANPYAG